METNLKLDPDKICRTCLCESTKMKLLSAKIDGEQKTLLDVLTFVANFNIKTGDKLPKQVCTDCEMIMCKADAFKRRFLEAESILNDHLNSEYFELEIPTKSSIKHEIAAENDILNVNRDSLPSTSLITASNSNIFEGNTLGLHTENLSIFDQLDLPNITIRRNNKTENVKEETENDFDHQNDVSMDFDDSNAYETLPIEFKQEISELKMYSCSCGTVFNKRDDYKAHLKTNECNGIKKSTNIKVEKKSGNRNILIKRQVLCSDCNIEFDTIKALKIHQRSHKNDEDNCEYECSFCMRKFNRKSSYTNHMKHHEEKGNIKHICKTCKREFQHKAHLDNHILAVHTRDKGFMCEQCLTNFTTQESLEIHKESHKVEKKHRCSECSKAFIMLSTLNDHIKTHTGEKPFLCSICGKGFSQKTNLAQHMRRHQGLKPFKCEECDRRFVSKGELVAHKRKHTGAHPFVCDDCGSGFTTSSSLVKHRRIHTGERPYACDLCSMRFAASGTLKNHRRTHTGEKPFQCSYCEKAFVQRQDLISHIRCHTGERPYACGCGQAFRKASALKAHLKMHGKDALCQR